MLRVLILDDDAMSGRGMGRSLSQSELQCEAAAVTTEAEAYAAVRQAETPFDVFLIDQRLGPGSDGITVLEELLHLSPDSDAIIFTRVGDEEAGMRAYRAGAYRSLYKPIAAQELVLILRSLCAWREARQERDGLMVLTAIAERAQSALTLPDLGAVMTWGGCRFGFERARLWLLEQDDTTLVGLSQRGNAGLEEIADIRFAVAESPYVSRALTQREPSIFHGEEYGQSYLHRHLAEFQRPEGEWIILPLWLRNRCLGMLVLDNYTRPQRIRPQQRQELTLLGQQVAAALERVHLHEWEQRKSRELEHQKKEKEVLAEIGRLVSNRAAIVGLDTLLLDVHKQVGQLIDASTFGVALRNEQTGRSELRLDIDKNQPQPRRMLSQRIGLVGYVIEHNRPLLLPKGSLGSQEFLKEHKIRSQVFDRSRSWLGVPLAIEGQAIGAIIVQSGEREQVYSEGDQKLLVAVASQVAGAIQTAWLKEAADRNARRLETLQRAGEALMKLAERDEQLLWHAALTITTADYALGFNRAMLFLIEDGGAILRGRMGIGQLTSREARRAWSHDRRIGRTFESYLRDLQADGVSTTAVDPAVRDLVRYLPDDQSAFREALETKQHVIVPEQEAASRLPELFISCFGQTTYALLPLLVGEKRLGVVVVDNIHNHEPLRDAPLSQLETWLAQVALVYENQRQHRISDQLIDVNHTVFAQIANVPLKETLMHICAAAQNIIGADCVMIYPLVPNISADAPRYDVANTGYVGLQADFCPQPKPRSSGVTMHVLQSGELLSVPDVTAEAWFDQKRQTNRTFFHRENVHAFIAAPIRDVAAESFSGILYLNFRTPQTFDEQDMRLAESFASMAGAAIHTSRLEGGVRESRDARTRELEILRDVLKTALQPTVSREDVAYTLLAAARELLLDLPDVVVTLILVEWKAPEDHAHEPREMRRQYYLRADSSIGERSSQELYIGITGEAFGLRKDVYAPDVNQPPWQELYRGRRLADMIGGSRPTRSELDVLIKLEGHQILGLFNVESPEVAAFSKEHKAIVKRLAAAAALALDNVRRQENLHNVLKAATAVMAPAELHDTLQAMLNQAQEIAPGVSAVTIWYKDPEIEQIVLGPYFGVHHPEQMVSHPTHADNTVAIVMRSRQAIWEPAVRTSGRTLRRFVTDEQIESVAALPLEANGEMVGAIFFNYRQQHLFTREERVLFPIIAAVAAASVRDALRLEEQRKGRERLQAALDITDAVGTILNLDETLSQIMRTLRNQIPYALPLVLTYNLGKHILEFAQASLEFYRIDEANLPLLEVGGPSIACRVARAALESGRAALDNVGDVREDPDYILVFDSTRSELCLALMSSDKRLLGVLVLESANLHAFSDDDVKLMQGIGPAISIAIDRAYQSAELRFNASVAAATALVAEMAHDINREIGTIRNEAYLLKQKLSPELRSSIEKIGMSAGRLATYARAPQSTEAETLDLDAWITQKVEEIAVKRGSGVKLQIETDAGGIDVRASLVLLERTLRHLVRNALEAMKGAGRLTVRTRRKNEQFVEVRVSNNGPSIPPHIRQRLFVERVSSKVTEHRAAESGLGLLFVRWAVEAMGGSIELLSKPDEEVTFAFTLPIAQPEEQRNSSDGDISKSR